VRGSRDTPHAGAARLPVIAVVVIGHGHSPLRMLLASPVAALGAFPGAMDGDVRRCLLAVAWGRFPAS
jgi:hypothetical protein